MADTFRVAALPVTMWRGGEPTVVALSGLGGSAPSWAPFAESLTEATVITPDLRGRGDAQGMTGPTGLAAHAVDVANVIDELDLTDVVLVGHSMGAYLAPVVAQQVPDRIRKLVLVDGGIPPKFPFFMGPTLTRMAFRKDLSKVDRDWGTVEELANKSRLGKMMRDYPEHAATIQRILVDSCTPALRPRADVQRCVDDAVDTFYGPSVVPALASLSVPADLILAAHKTGTTDKPFLSDKAVAPWLARQPLLKAQRLPGNHVTVLFAPEVLAAVRS